MTFKQAGWKIYKQQMELLDHGDALWEPAPIYSYKRVKLGDVGYIRRGRFHLLFSAGCPLGPRKLGVDVPPTFEPLDVGPIIYSQPLLPGYLCTDSIKETGGGLGASIDTTPFLEPGASFSFELTEKQGAALVTKYRTYREDIELESAFEDYTKRHYDSWVTFARNARHGNDIKPILVAGADMTRDFAMIAYSNNTTRLSSEFTTSVPLLASASMSAWGKWHTHGLVHTNCGPQLCSPPSPDSLDLNSTYADEIDATPNEYNQCVFIRYYTMRKRALMFPKVIKAGAGPHDLGSGDNHGETLPELTVQLSSDSDTGSDSGRDSTTDYSSSVTSYESDLEVFHNVSSEEEDTFDVIANYVFENSEAESVLVHHHDISQIREGMLTTEISEILSQRQPAIVLGSDGVGRIMRPSHCGEAKGKIDVEKDPQRHSLPNPAKVKKRDRSAPRPQSMYVPRNSTQGGLGPVPGGFQTALDLDPSFPGNSWRYSAQSVTSNGSTSTLSDSRSQPGHSRLSDRFSLQSKGSFSSALTRFSASTSSTLLTAPSSSKRSSRASMAQKDKRFSSVRLVDNIPWESDEVSEPGTPLPPATPPLRSSGSWLPRTTTPRSTSSEGGPTHAMEQGTLHKLHGRKYAASLSSLLRKRDPPEGTPSVSAGSESETSSLGKRARLKRFVKDIFKV